MRIATWQTPPPAAARRRRPGALGRVAGRGVALGLALVVPVLALVGHGTARGAGAPAADAAAAAHAPADLVPRAKLVRAVRWARREKARTQRLRRTLRVRTRRPSYRHAMRLAHAVYGVPVAGLSALTWCESRHRPRARNRVALSGSNATGAAQILYHPSGRRSSTWHTTPFRHLSPYDLTANMLAAGYIWRRAGGSFREWRDVCGVRGDAAR